METLEILDKLISFPTVSNASNRDLIEFVRSFLAEYGAEPDLFESSDGRKANLFATLGPSDVSGVVLSGHTDVVPVDGQNWSTDPFRMKVADSRAYGRGAADMKGYVACALALVGRIGKARLREPLHLAFSYDEEIGCVGVRSMIDALETRAVKPRLIIVGEPTLMRVATGHKGKLAARATCCGVEGHSALAPKALNAIHMACDFVGLVRRSQEEIARGDVQDSDYEIPYTTLHVGKIGGGTALNIVPNICTVDFEIRNVAEDSAQTILDRLMDAAGKIVTRTRTYFPEADMRFDIVNTYPGLSTQDADAVNFVSRLAGSDMPYKVPFGTEGGLFASRLGVPAVVCGPGSMDQGHKPDEFIALDQLAACDRMMDRLFENLRI